MVSFDGNVNVNFQAVNKNKINDFIILPTTTEANDVETQKCM